MASLVRKETPSVFTPATQLSAADVYKKITWRILPFLVLCYIIAVIDRSNVGFAKLQFSQDLGFDDAVYGLGGGLFFLSYALFEVPSNLLLQRTGVRSMLLRIMVLWGMFTVAMASMSTVTEFYVLRLLLGVAEAGFFPGVLLYITFWVPASRRARFTGFFMASLAIAGLLGGPMSGAIMHFFDGFYGLKGWQWLFIVEGAPAVLLGVIAYFYLDNGPQDAKWLTDQEKLLVQHDLDAERQAKAGSSHHLFKGALLDRRFYMLALTSIATTTSTGGLFFWLPTIVKRAGTDSVWEIGLLSCIPFMIGLIVQYFVARHSDHKQERHYHAATCILVAAIGWVLMPLASVSPVFSILLLSIVAAGTFGAMGPFWAIPPALLSGSAAAGGIALITSVGAVGNFAMPTLTGWLTARTGSMAMGQYFYAGVLLVGAISLLLSSRVVRSKANPAGIEDVK